MMSGIKYIAEEVGTLNIYSRTHVFSQRLKLNVRT